MATLLNKLSFGESRGMFYAGVTMMWPHTAPQCPSTTFASPMSLSHTEPCHAPACPRLAHPLHSRTATHLAYPLAHLACPFAPAQYVLPAHCMCLPPHVPPSMLTSYPRLADHHHHGGTRGTQWQGAWGRMGCDSRMRGMRQVCCTVPLPGPTCTSNPFRPHRS